MRSIAQSHPVGIIGPVITGNAFFPIWYHIHGFAGPRELGWSDTLYSFLESDGPVQCNAGMCFTGPTPTVKSRVITRPTTNKDKDAIEAEFKRLWMDLDAKFRAQKDIMRADEQQAAIADLNKGMVSRPFDLSRPPLN